jgi:hypothetical protein
MAGVVTRVGFLAGALVVFAAYIGFDARQIFRRQSGMANANGGNSAFKYGTAIAAVLFAVAILITLGTAAWWAFTKTPPGYSSGSAAAAVLFLTVVALVLARPSLTMDDTPGEGGEPSTMRILSLAIVLTFCAIMLRNGWNDGELPSLKEESQWVWLVTAALGGKALQKYAEVQQKNEEIKAKGKKSGTGDSG